MLEDVGAHEEPVFEPVGERCKGRVDRIAPMRVRSESGLGARAGGTEPLGVEPLDRVLAGSAIAGHLTRRFEGAIRDGDCLDLGHRLQECVQNEWVELRSAATPHQVQGFFQAERRSIDPIAGKRVEDVGNARDPALEGDRFADQAARVTAAVEMLVVRPGDRRRELEQLGLGAREKTVTQLGVLLHRHARVGSGVRV